MGSGLLTAVDATVVVSPEDIDKRAPVTGTFGSTAAVHVKRADIDGIRGVAVLLVVLFHAKLPGWWAVPGGFIGVDAFFVLSGYLVTLVILQDLLHGGDFSLMKFYSRRVCRLLPMSMLVLFLVCTYSVEHSPLHRIGRYSRLTHVQQR
jgi:peptidoglycan/LPS O-acetylase OafA/YrhL